MELTDEQYQELLVSAEDCVADCEYREQGERDLEVCIMECLRKSLQWVDPV